MYYPNFRRMSGGQRQYLLIRKFEDVKAIGIIRQHSIAEMEWKFSEPILTVPDLNPNRE